ncbi:MAG: lipase [Alphaproteobacteria bacterium]|jgi:acyl-CoA thioesterase-1|nr:lipase [Alphaproteobacteria bacterium]PPR13475.1 MAG: hypothetical protein CFH42_01227 [Alphaproteobacteria bacterium MarineAlpha12_Bin1]|tara:strand:- start:9110 stop:9748 length:639 start_codon:yes stop_codon:yes gene_type:complete
MTAMRICFVGDSITVGSGDNHFLGWPGRLCQHETKNGHDVTLYNLGVRGDTSDMVMNRWKRECEVRLPIHVSGRLVMSFGLNDTAEEANSGIRVPMNKTIANITTVLDEAKNWLPTIMVGPVPIIEDMQPYIFPDGTAYQYSNTRIAELNDHLAKICLSMDIQYLNLFEILIDNEDWIESQRECDGVHATDKGYETIHKIVMNWDSWRSWFS